MNYPVGSLVRARGREWIVLPREEEDLLLLRPLGGVLVLVPPLVVTSSDLAHMVTILRRSIEAVT